MRSDGAADRARRTRVGSGVAAALGVLEVLTGADEPLPLRALAAGLGVSKATVARVVAELVASGYVARQPGGRTYTADYGVLTLGGDFLKRLPLRQRAAPYLHRLASRTGLVCYLGVLWRRETVILDRVTPQLVHESVLEIGKHVPMHGSSLAKAILAFTDDEARRRTVEGFDFVPLTPRTVTTPEAFLADLERTRARGYATSDGEQSARARSVAAPVLDARGRPVGALAAADWEAERMPAEDLAGVVEWTREAALAVSHAIGYLGQPAVPVETNGTRRQPPRDGRSAPASDRQE